MNDSKNINAVRLGKLGGKIGGRATSKAKKKAAQINGRLGGRPKKTCKRNATNSIPKMDFNKQRKGKNKPEEKGKEIL